MLFFCDDLFLSAFICILFFRRIYSTYRRALCSVRKSKTLSIADATDDHGSVDRQCARADSCHDNRSSRNADPDPYTISDAVAQLVRFRDTVHPRPDWRAPYAERRAAFQSFIEKR